MDILFFFGDSHDTLENVVRVPLLISVNDDKKNSYNKILDRYGTTVFVISFTYQHDNLDLRMLLSS